MKSLGAYSKIKIVRVVARLDIGGAPLHVVELGTGFNRDRFESVPVAGVENPGERSLLEYVEQRSSHPFIIPEIVGEANFGWRDVVAIAEVYRVLKRENQHIVDTHTAKAGFVGRIAARLAGRHSHVSRSRLARLLQFDQIAPVAVDGKRIGVLDGSDCHHERKRAAENRGIQHCAAPIAAPERDEWLRVWALVDCSMRRS